MCSSSTESLSLVLLDLVGDAIERADGIEIVESLTERNSNLGPSEAVLISVALGLLVDHSTLEGDLFDENSKVDGNNGPVHDHIVAREYGFHEIAGRLVVSTRTTVHEVEPFDEGPHPEDAAAEGLEETDEARQLHLFKPRGNFSDQEEAEKSLLHKHERVVEQPQVASGPTLIEVNIEKEIPNDANKLNYDVRNRHQHEVGEPRMRREVAFVSGRVGPVLLLGIIEANIFEVVHDLAGLLADLVELILNVLALFLEDTHDVVEYLLRLRLIIVLLCSIILLFLEALQLGLLSLDLRFSAHLFLELLLQILQIVGDSRLIDSVGQVRAKFGRDRLRTFHGGLDEHLWQ